MQKRQMTTTMKPKDHQYPTTMIGLVMSTTNQMEKNDFYTLRSSKQRGGGEFDRKHLLVISLYFENHLYSSVAPTAQTIKTVLANKESDDVPWPFVDHFHLHAESLRNVLKNMHAKFSSEESKRMNIPSFEWFKRLGQDIVNLYQSAFAKCGNQLVTK